MTTTVLFSAVSLVFNLDLELNRDFVETVSTTALRHQAILPLTCLPACCTGGPKGSGAGISVGQGVHCHRLYDYRGEDLCLAILDEGRFIAILDVILVCIVV